MEDGSAGCVHEIDVEIKKSVESNHSEELLPLGREVKIVDPELTTDRTAFWQSPNPQHEQAGIGPGREFSGGRLPESGLFQFIAVVGDLSRESILKSEVRTARAFELSIFVIGGEFVGSVGLDRNELPNAGIVYSWPIKSD